MSNLQVRFPVVIDFAKNTYVEVEVTKRSRNGYIMEFYFLNQGKAIPKEDIGVVSLKATTEGGAIVFNDILLAKGEYVEYKISETILAEIGRSTCVLQLMDAEGNLINSFEWYVNVKTSLYDENTYVQQDDITAVRSYVLRAESAADKSEEHEKYLREAHANLGDLEEKLGVVKEDMEDYLQEVEEKVENGAFTGATGIQGPQGPQGETGPQGPQGETGPQGASGITTPIAGYYVLSVEGGILYVEYDGDTEPNFELDDEGNLYYIVSGKHKVQIGKVKGEKGDKGDTGEKGDPGEQGPQGEVGPIGENGKDGKTAYEYAKDGGYTGSEEMFAESLANAAELEAYKANSILSKASGDVVTTTDSAKVKPKNIKLFGKGKQRTTSGKNKLSPNNLGEQTINGVTFTPVYTDGMLDYILVNGTATANTYYKYMKVSKDIIDNYDTILTGGGNNCGLIFYTSEIGDWGGGKTIPKGQQGDGGVSIKVNNGVTVSNVKVYPMIRLATETDATYEPYTNNEPSPNINYPQIPEFLGESGSIVGKVLGENIITYPYITDNGTVKSGVTCTHEEDGIILLNGTSTSTSEFDLWKGALPKGTYTLSWLQSSENTRIYLRKDNVLVASRAMNDKAYSFNSDGTGEYAVSILLLNKKTFSNEAIKVQLELNSVATEIKPPSTEQPFTFLTPNGLRGVPLGQTIPDAIKNSPIHMSGVYWDEAEQQYYIGDTKNENGKDVQRIWKGYNTKTLAFTEQTSGRVKAYIPNYFDVPTKSPFLQNGDNTMFAYSNIARYSSWAMTDKTFAMSTDLFFYNNASKTFEEINALFAELGTSVEICGVLREPIITDTTEEEKAQLDKLVMNYPNTTIVNDAGAYMEVEYVCDTKEHIKQNYTPNSVTEDILERLGNVESQIALNS